jgi:hypothetical protein
VAPIDYETMTDQEIAVAKQALVEECNAILADGVFDEYVATGSSADAYAASKAYCRDNSSMASGGGGGDFLGIIKASGGGSSTVWDKYCQDFVTTSSSDEETSLLTKTASQALVNAWAQCMTSRVGLACSQKPDTRAIEIVWDELNNEGELVKTTLDTSNLSLSNPSLARPTLPIGKTSLLFSSPDRSRNSTLVFNGNAEKTNVRHSCTVVSKGSAGIRADVTKSWSKLTSRYADIVDALHDMRTSSNAIYVDQALSAANARYSTANAKKAACNNGESCSAPPLGSVFNFTYRTPGLKCPNGKVIKSPGTKTRSAIELDGELMAFWMNWEASEAGRNFVYCSGAFRIGTPKPYF